MEPPAVTEMIETALAHSPQLGASALTLLLLALSRRILDESRARMRKGLGLAALVVLGLVWIGELQSLLLSLTAVAMALVLATKELIQCATGALASRAGGAYAVGDRVHLDGTSGRVVAVNWLTTTILETDARSLGSRPTGRRMVVPNSRAFCGGVHVEATAGAFRHHVVAITLEERAGLREAMGRAEAEARALSLPGAPEARVALATTDLGKPRLDVVVYCAWRPCSRPSDGSRSRCWRPARPRPASPRRSRWCAERQREARSELQPERTEKAALVQGVASGESAPGTRLDRDPLRDVEDAAELQLVLVEALAPVCGQADDRKALRQEENVRARPQAEGQIGADFVGLGRPVGAIGGLRVDESRQSPNREAIAGEEPAFQARVEQPSVGWIERGSASASRRLASADATKPPRCRRRRRPPISDTPSPSCVSRVSKRSCRHSVRPRSVKRSVMPYSASAWISALRKRDVAARRRSAAKRPVASEAPPVRMARPSPAFIVQAPAEACVAAMDCNPARRARALTIGQGRRMRLRTNISTTRGVFGHGQVCKRRFKPSLSLRVRGACRPRTALLLPGVLV